jgi:hypothetical protein
MDCSQCYILLTLGRSEYLNMERSWHDRSPYVNQSLFNPEWIYGVGNTFQVILIRLTDDIR